MNKLKQFIETTAYNATMSGYRPIPLYEGGTAAAFGKGQRYDDYRTPEWSMGRALEGDKWLPVPIQHVSLALDNCILVDYDGNKSDDIISVEQLATMLGITLDVLNSAQVQSNVEGDSLHYLFRIDDQSVIEAIRTKSGFKMSNDGHWIQHIDIKTGNQLIHLKPHKTLTLPHITKLVTAPGALIDTLRVAEVKHVVGEYAVCEVENPDALAWLAQDCAELAMMEADTGRNGKFNEITLLHMSRVAGGFLDETKTRQALIEAGRCCDMTEREMTATMGSASRSAKPVSTVNPHPSTARNRAVELMMATHVPGDIDVVVHDMTTSKASIDLSWEIKKTMERITGDLQRPDPASPPFEITINPEVVEKIITRSQWSCGQSKLSVLSDENTFNTYSEKDMFNLLVKHFGTVWINDDIDRICKIVDAECCNDITGEKLAKKLAGAGTCVITDYLKMMNQRKRMDVRVDMFADRPRMEWSPEKVTVVMTWKPIVVSADVVDQEVLNDYRTHFPQLDDVLSHIVASRFASNRKKFFTWLHATSDWGKGLFTGLMTELGVCVELSVAECEKAFEGAPLGRDASEFYRAFVLLFDEFKKVKSELKQLENSIPITPKNQMKQGVELFTKMFTSAEHVDSLAGANGVEDQFANRFSYIRGNGSINSRPMFNVKGRRYYATHVRNYIGQQMNRMVDEYIAMGENDAVRKADNFGDDFHIRHGIDVAFNRLSSSIPEMCEEFKKWCIAKHSTGFEGAMGMCVRSDDGYYFLKSSAKMYNDWVFETASRSESMTLGQKKNEVLRTMCADGVGVKSHRVNGSVVKSVRFKLHVERSL